MSDPSNTAKHSMLVVDDEPEVGNLFKKVLSRNGYEVDTVLNGTSAIELAQRKQFEVVILDLKMPGMDGIETYRRLKAMGQRALTIVLTGNGGIDSARDAMSLGAHDYFTKPFRVDEVQESIREGLAQAARR